MDSNITQQQSNSDTETVLQDEEVHGSGLRITRIFVDSGENTDEYKNIHIIKKMEFFDNGSDTECILTYVDQSGKEDELKFLFENSEVKWETICAGEFFELDSSRSVKEYLKHIILYIFPRSCNNKF